MGAVQQVHELGWKEELTWIRGLQALNRKEEGEGTTAGKECVCFVEQAAPTKEIRARCSLG